MWGGGGPHPVNQFQRIWLQAFTDLCTPREERSDGNLRFFLFLKFQLLQFSHGILTARSRWPLYRITLYDKINSYWPFFDSLLQPHSPMLRKTGISEHHLLEVNEQCGQGENPDLPIAQLFCINFLSIHYPASFQPFWKNSFRCSGVACVGSWVSGSRRMHVVPYRIGRAGAVRDSGPFVFAGGGTQNFQPSTRKRNRERLGAIKIIVFKYMFRYRLSFVLWKWSDMAALVNC